MQNFFTLKEMPELHLPFGAILWPITSEENTGALLLNNCGIMSFSQYGGHGRHQHAPEEADKVETLYCLEGEGVHVFWDENDNPVKHVIRKGDLICCVRGMPHMTTNEKREPFICLIINAN